MDKTQAKAIGLPEILRLLGSEPVRVRNGKAWYFSPLRQEKTPSFMVDLHTNRWYDFGEAKGGDSIDLVQCYLQSTHEAHTLPDALRWLGNMTGGAAVPLWSPPEKALPESELVLISNRPLQHRGLMNYVEKRGIAPLLAAKHLRELRVRNQATGKYFFSLGFANEEGGYELRNPFFKGCLRPKSLSFVRGKAAKSIHFFEGFMDYLSALSQAGQSSFVQDVIVLNSVSCLGQALAYVQNYGYRRVYTWLDNDPAGEKATARLADFCKTQQGLLHQPLNRLYLPYRDVNAWHMHQRGLRL